MERKKDGLEQEKCGIKQDDRIRLQVREHWVVLAGGLFTLGFALFILLMDLGYPAAEGSRTLLVLGLLFMAVCGIMVCMTYFCRRLSVEDMDIYYVNHIGKKKHFTLDDIGYCKLILADNREESVTLYDLLGEKLCKLELHMCGGAEFLQYLLDNGVKAEWNGTEKETSHIMEPFLAETAVCREEIGGYAEVLYDTVRPVFMEWEKRYQKFEAQWEFGLAEYVQEDMEPEREMWQWKSTVWRNGREELPEEYSCVLEAYLKRGEEYVVDRKGHAVGIFLPYIQQTVSYQVGERRRIRKADEAMLKEQLGRELVRLAEELPKYRYHTQVLTLGHELGKTAG